MTQPMERFNRGELRVVGRRLRSLRVSKGWSLKKLSEAAHTSVAAIRKIELGESNPSLLTILAIVEALGEPIDRLVTSARSASDSIRLTRASDTEDEKRKGATAVRSHSDGLSDPAMSGRSVQLDANATLPVRSDDGKSPVFGFVLEGSLLIEHDEEGRVRCEAGDAFHMHRADAGTIRASADTGARIIVIRDHHHMKPNPGNRRKPAH